MVFFVVQTVPQPLLLKETYGVPPESYILAPSARPPMAIIRLGDTDGLPPTLALRQRFAKTAPEYISSFGDKVFERVTRSGLKLVGWRPINQVQQIWEKLERPLSSLIFEKRDFWENRRPRTRQPNSPADPKYPSTPSMLLARTR